MNINITYPNLSGTGKIRAILTVSKLQTLTVRMLCDIIYRYIWDNLKCALIQTDSVDLIASMQMWIDTYLNVPLRIELLKRTFFHEFGFESKSFEPPNDTDGTNLYFQVWRIIFQILYHPAMKEFILPDVKSILVDRMYLKMEDHLNYHRGIVLQYLVLGFGIL